MADHSAEKSDAKLRATFFRSITLVTSVSGIILSGSEGRLFPSGLTPAFAVMGWLIVDHLKWLRIPVLVGNLFGIVALMFAADEFVGGTLYEKLLSGAHLIVYLTWIVLVLPKLNRQYWWLITLSLLQLAIAGVVSTGVGFGGALLGMMLLLIWTLSVFSLFRAQDHHVRMLSFAGLQRDAGGGPSRTSHSANSNQSGTNNMTGKDWKRFLLSFLGFKLREPDANLRAGLQSRSESSCILIRNGLQRDSSEIWVGWRFRGVVVASYVVAVVLALFVFAAFPRVWVNGTGLLGEGLEGTRNFQNRTGFTNNVELGEIGRVMQSNERAFAFEVLDLSSNQPVSAEIFAEAMNMDEVRFRGNVLAHYADGQWTPGFSEKGDRRFDHFRDVGSYARHPAAFRVEVTQDPPIGTFAFAPYPVSSVQTAAGNKIIQTELSSSLIWSNRTEMSTTLATSFRVECPRLDRNSDATFEFWSNPIGVRESRKVLYANRRTEFANGLYLMDGFTGPRYEFVDGREVAIKPTYSKREDLEYRLPRLFKVANDLCSENDMLVPSQQRVARIVNYLSNENGFVYSLTQEHKDRSLDPVEDFLLNTKSGHCEYFASACTLMLQSVRVPARLINGYYGSEVNALTGKNEVRQRHAHAWVEAFIDDRWQTVDPTPSSERREDLQTNQSTSLISDIQTAISDLWNDGIHKMSAERQKEFFAPVISSSKSLFQTIRERGILQSVRMAAKSFIESPSSWISWQGGVATFLLLLFAATTARWRILQRLIKWLQVLTESFSQSHRTTRSVIRFYENFCTLCRQHGVTFPDANSALENAQMALARFRPRLPSPELQALPATIAVAFNEVRFGSLTLSSEKAASIGRDLSAFAEALNLNGSTTNEKPAVQKSDLSTNVQR